MKFHENDYAANLKRTYKSIHTIEFTARKGFTYYFAAVQKNGEWKLFIQESGGEKSAKTSKARYADYEVVE